MLRREGGSRNLTPLNICAIITGVKSFRWNDWNVAHIASHGITPCEAEYVVEHATRPWPANVGKGRYEVVGRGLDGEYLHVVYIFSPPGVVYVIHARPLREIEKRRYRRRLR
jgi:uncharacterized DUF497 family protein